MEQYARVRGGEIGAGYVPSAGPFGPARYAGCTGPGGGLQDPFSWGRKLARKAAASLSPGEPRCYYAIERDCPVARTPWWAACSGLVGHIRAFANGPKTVQTDEPGLTQATVTQGPC